MDIVSKNRASETLLRLATLTAAALVFFAAIGVGALVQAYPVQSEGLHGWEAGTVQSSTADDGPHGWEVAAQTRSVTPMEAYSDRLAGMAEAYQSIPGPTPAALAASDGLHGWEVAQASGAGDLVAAQGSDPPPVEAPAQAGGASFPDEAALVGLLTMGLLLGIAGTLAVGHITARRTHA